METGVIFFPSPFTFSSKLQLTLPNPKNLRKFSALCSTITPNNNSQESNSSNNNGGSKETNSPTALNIRYRARSRRRQAKQEKRKQEEEEEEGAKPSKKKWEEMRVSEKALELYLGEKGLLFWLNKLAYASIFLVIGGWILFRFVGPSLGLYQLDSLPLSPTSIFKNG